MPLQVHEIELIDNKTGFKFKISLYTPLNVDVSEKQDELQNIVAAVKKLYLPKGTPRPDSDTPISYILYGI